MANERIESGGHHMLIWRDVDDGAGVAVRFERHEYNRKSEHDHRVSNSDDEPWHVRPTQAIVDAGDDKEQNRRRAQYTPDQLLALFLLGPPRQSPLHERRVVLQKIEGHDQGTQRKYEPVYPSLPIGGPTRDNDKQPRERRESQRSYQCLLCQVIHSGSIIRARVAAILS